MPHTCDVGQGGLFPSSSRKTCALPGSVSIALVCMVTCFDMWAGKVFCFVDKWYKYPLEVCSFSDPPVDFLRVIPVVLLKHVFFAPVGCFTKPAS